MLKVLGRGWRVLATGFSFSCFGLGGLILGLVVFPLLAVAVHPRARRTRWARWTIHYGFKLFIQLMRAVGVLRYRILGREKLQRSGMLVLANHPTLIDVVFLISLIPNANCVVKARLFRNPFTRGPVRATGYICNDSGVGLIQDCIDSLRAGNNLIIFPEGTRTPVGEIAHLQRGAANIAVRGPFNITPVTISCVPLSLTKGLPWWRVPESPMNFVIDVRDDIPIERFLVQAAGEQPLAARRVTDYLHDYFFSKARSNASA